MKSWITIILTACTLAWSSLAFCGEIHDAAKNGDLNKVKDLLLANPDLVSNIDTNGLSPLHIAARSGHKSVAELLLANKADVNARDKADRTPLEFAVLRGHKDIADLLLANRADVNARDKNDNTPLILAADFQAPAGDKDSVELQLVELLLANHADVNAKNTAIP
jgi:ankyrin repeat protein